MTCSEDQLRKVFTISTQEEGETSSQTRQAALPCLRRNTPSSEHRDSDPFLGAGGADVIKAHYCIKFLGGSVGGKFSSYV